ncbi:grpE protein, mitochondrial [Dorcoceras hygrometricum]|uniref:GrpE protein homolog n=1 Tax=Dorcoceras hygrometricum TaxID=472368 RepID=A0A2Z7C8D0_9LAMI|nr:grpE protein, mitochondrial [Dorcoceras hygrometricum]
MAASAPASLYGYTTFSLNTHRRSSLHFPRPAKFLCLQRDQQLMFPGNPITRNVFSSFSIPNSSLSKGHSKAIELETRRSSFFKPSVSAKQESQPYQSNGKDMSSSSDFQEDNSLSTLKSLIKAYKEAVLVGDEKTIYEIEDVLFAVDKENKELVEKISALSAEMSSGKEKYTRLQADFDNYRKRAENERLLVRSNAQGEVIESLLPMVDSFERAKQQIILETEKEKKIDTSYQGIYKQFVEIMRSLRVTAVPTVGKPFDPSVHEAIAREESHEFKEGIVIQEFRRGFLLGDRLLRPAMVKVSSGPGKPPAVQDRLSTQPPSVVGLENP